jgi:hypothetical protein
MERGLISDTCGGKRQATDRRIQDQRHGQPAGVSREETSKTPEAGRRFPGCVPI